MAGTAKPLCFEFGREPCAAKLVDQFEGTKLPIIAEPHGFIDRLDLVGGVATRAAA
ncbi:protein of unknown function (plasmid) [Methylocella tundrae]|uniref:Uncharacterized protein n=1 Tax=Methylocella tundrae TaxID=227605 RepID=A0A4U8Z6Y1_METTU|nr:protein of unknown function [Methylocella tundrae]